MGLNSTTWGVSGVLLQCCVQGHKLLDSIYTEIRDPQFWAYKSTAWGVYGTTWGISGVLAMCCVQGHELLDSIYTEIRDPRFWAY